MKKTTSSLIEDKEKIRHRGLHSSEPQKAHPLVSLLLWHKMVAVRSVSSLATVVRQLGSETKIQVLAFLNSIPGHL